MSEAMSPQYREYWNADVQAQIDVDIEKNRKADAKAAIGAPPGAKVKVEQTRHAFIFGAHLFNFDQLGTEERNAKYKALYGHDGLFNSATVAFYWRPFEPVEGKMRFDPAPEDAESWWNNCKDPKSQRHWRRPPTEPCVAFTEKKGIRCHGHPLMWANPQWQYPDWLMAKLPRELLAEMLTDDRSGVSILKQPMEEVLKRLPADFPAAVESACRRRFEAIAARYAGRVQSWDVCNESVADWIPGRLVPGAPICRGYHHSWMPGDYCRWAFREAMRLFPESTRLNINDYNLSQAYLDQIADLRASGCKIDIVGAQMHRFDPQRCLDIADGVTDDLSPALEWEKMNRLSQANLPIHLSEITITAPNNDARGQEIQATIARNLYRLWFSTKNMMGITWWNVVDDCGAPGEPSVSGLFSRDMEPKPAYEALNSLINGDWKTKTAVTADADGAVSFRGFRGLYRLTWTDADGRAAETTLDLA